MNEWQLPHSGICCSVVVPVYNGAATIQRCLDALANQTCRADRYEIIVVDDGSNDATAEIVRSWGQCHPQIHLSFVQQANAGPAAARNHGARMAQGAILLFTDADCTPSVRWIDAFLAVFNSPEPPAGAAGAYESRQTSAAARFAQFEFEERYALMRHHAAIDLVSTYAAAFRRDLFLSFGGFDEAFPKANNEDVEFSFRLSGAGHRLVFAPDAVVAHEHDDSWPDYARTKMGRAFWRMVVYRRFPDKAVKDTYTPQTVKLQIPLSLLMDVGIAGCVVMRSGRWLWLTLPFLLSTTPSLWRAWQQRRVDLLPWLSFGQWVRATAFAVGVAVELLTGASALKSSRQQPHLPTVVHPGSTPGQS